MKTRRRKTPKPKRRKEPTATRRRGPSAAELQKQLDQQAGELTEARRHLTEALEQQAATSEVLKVISSSPGELDPVFQAMLADAVRLCAAKFGILWVAENGGFRSVALYGLPPALTELRQREPFVEFGPLTGVGRVLKTKQVLIIDDMKKDAAFLTHDPRAKYLVELGGARTGVFVPLLKGAEGVGVLVIYRQEVRPFTGKQIALLTNFAAQAVIAIENTRLLNELRQRTDDLSEALEQQTATSEVLKVISSSQGELQPVFQAMLEYATRICQAQFGILNLYDGEAFYNVALHNPPPQFDAMHRGAAIRPHPDMALGIVARTKGIAHIDDIRAQKPYLEGHEAAVRLAEDAGARTLLVVPMLKERELVGTIGIYRQEVRPFSDKQIELVRKLRSPGRHRHREHAPAERTTRIAAAADRDL